MHPCVSQFPTSGMEIKFNHIAFTITSLKGLLEIQTISSPLCAFPRKNVNIVLKGQDGKVQVKLCPLWTISVSPAKAKQSTVGPGHEESHRQERKQRFPRLSPGTEMLKKKPAKVPPPAHLEHSICKHEGCKPSSGQHGTWWRCSPCSVSAALRLLLNVIQTPKTLERDKRVIKEEWGREGGRGGGD